jgi:hypothetical protein
MLHRVVGWQICIAILHIHLSGEKCDEQIYSISREFLYSANLLDRGPYVSAERL